MKLKPCSVVVVVVVFSLLLAVVMSSGGYEAEAVTCKPTELSPCLGAMTSSSTPPSKLCCTKIRQQKPCLCQYVKNPYLKQYVSSPNAKKVASTCRVPFPKC